MIGRLKQENLKARAKANHYRGFRGALRLVREKQFYRLWWLCKRKLRIMTERKTASMFLPAGLRAPAEGKTEKSADTNHEPVAPDYFSGERIAVYTVIFGTYDLLREPKCCPDNCDYFLISDTVQPPKDSVWKQMDLPPEVRERISGMNAILKNRFLKMRSDLLFPDYQYSVYLDGNVQMVTDPTEFINWMPDSGVSFFRHAARDCVYEEARAVLIRRKAAKKDIRKLVRFLKEEKMPPHYGLLECPVIVRRHHQPECLEIMEAWWKLFRQFPYRDQLLLPCVLYQRGIRPEELAWLGDDIHISPSFRKYHHQNGEKQELDI